MWGPAAFGRSSLSLAAAVTISGPCVAEEVPRSSAALSGTDEFAYRPDAYRIAVPLHLRDSIGGAHVDTVVRAGSGPNGVVVTEPAEPQLGIALSGRPIRNGGVSMLLSHIGGVSAVVTDQAISSFSSSWSSGMLCSVLALTGAGWGSGPSPVLSRASCRLPRSCAVTSR